jgi:hypothetical protein
VYFDVRTYGRLALLSCRELLRRRPLRLRHLFSLFVFFCLLPCVEIFNAVCFFLDDLLFPRYRRLEIGTPVFIIGNPRSGTTLLHRLLARDRQRFFSFCTWELMFPAIVQKTALDFLGRLDRQLGGFVARGIERFERAWLKEFNKIHPVGLFLPEEDDKLLLHAVASLDLIWLFPFPELTRLARFDEAVPAMERQRIMDFYTACVKRQAYLRCGDSLLSKNPLFSPKVRTLWERFPNARIVYLVRNPLDVIPSMLSVADRLWERMSGEVASPPMEEALYEGLKFFYTYPLGILDGADPGAYAIVSYEDLVRDPARVVEEVYTRLGFEMTAEFRETLGVAAARTQTYQSEHAYSLEARSVTSARIVADLKEVFDRFGFDRRGVGSERHDVRGRQPVIPDGV